MVWYENPHKCTQIITQLVLLYHNSTKNPLLHLAHLSARGGFFEALGGGETSLGSIYVLICGIDNGLVESLDF